MGILVSCSLHCFLRLRCWRPVLEGCRVESKQCGMLEVRITNVLVCRRYYKRQLSMAKSGGCNYFRKLCFMLNYLVSPEYSELHECSAPHIHRSPRSCSYYPGITLTGKISYINYYITTNPFIRLHVTFR
jgi:hypothetical protein